MHERRPAYEIRLALAARRDSIAILKWTRNEFGEAAALRYGALMAQALCDIGDDPERSRSKERPEVMIKGALSTTFRTPEVTGHFRNDVETALSLSY